MKILIVKTSALGDIIHAFPVVQFLKDHYTDVQIDWVIEKAFAELVQSHPAVDRVITVQTKKWRKNLWNKETWQEMKSFRQTLRQVEYDLVFDLQGNIKSGLITGLARGKRKVGFGFQTLPEWPNLLFTHSRYNPPQGKNIREDYLYIAQMATNCFSTDIKGVQLKVSPQEKQKIEQIIGNPLLQGGDKVMVCPGSNWANKQMSTEGLQTLLEKIHQAYGCRFLFVWGTDGEKEVCREIANSFPDHSLIVDKLPLPTLQNLMGAMNMVIAMDSLPLHLAGTTQVPTYGIFGASSAKKYKPLSSNAYQGPCPYGKAFEKRCPILRTCLTGSCIKEIDINSLFKDFTKKMTNHF